ncbi:MAG: response regulator [Bacteroidetes bacterium]|nr:response regulator [Bacteroidota bacterium]
MKTSVIFIVDINPIHRNLIRYHIGLNKFTNVYAFPTGEECLFRMQKNAHPDFLITSYFTGNYTGFDFLRSVLEISPSSQVIFFDTFEDPHLAGKLLDAGASDYVVKTRNPDAGISELLKNVIYLAREKAMNDVQ